MKESKPTETLQNFLVDGAKYKTLLSRKYNLRKAYEPVDHKKIVAFIPGTIKKVYIKTGDIVKKGDKLLTLEAMKMSNNVVFSTNGVVKAIYVNSGDVVSNKQLLAELE